MSLVKANNLKLRHFQYVLAVAETKSFTRAAELCFVTQSTLSSGIKDIEMQLGHDIFDRSRREINLTAFGAQLLPEIQDVLRKSDHILTMSRNIDGDYAGPFRLGIIPTIAPYLLPYLLPHLRRSQPKLDLILHESVSETLVNDVAKGHIDAALLAFPYDIGDLEHETLFDEGFYLLKPKEGDNPPFLESDEIDASSLLLLDDGHCLRDHALAVCANQNPEERKTFRATSLTTLVQMVRHGYGTTLLPEMAVREFRAFEDLTAIPIRDNGSRRQIGLIWRKKSPLQNVIRTLGAEIGHVNDSELDNTGLNVA